MQWFGAIETNNKMSISSVGWAFRHNSV